MKHRLLLLILFVFTTSVAGWAQKSTAPSYTVKGVLIDALTQEGEPYATIKIAKKNAPDKAVKMAVTGANGKFQDKLNVAAGILSTSTFTKGFCATTSTPFNTLLASEEIIVPKSTSFTDGFRVNSFTIGALPIEEIVMM